MRLGVIELGTDGALECVDEVRQYFAPNSDMIMSQFYYSEKSVLGFVGSYNGLGEWDGDKFDCVARKNQCLVGFFGMLNSRRT